MATGSLVNSVCYDSVALANDAYFSAYPAETYQDPTNSLVHQVVKFEQISSVWMRSVYGNAPWGNSLWSQTVATPPTFPLCISPSESFTNGVNFGWSVALVMVFAWGFSVAAKVLK